MAPSAHAAFPGANGPIVYIDSSSNINLVNPSTGVVSQLCPSAACGTPSASDRPEVSANGQTIVFPNATGIATLPITGGGFSQITSDNGNDPSFSPDGSTIVYQASLVLKRVAATGGSSTSISGAKPADEPEVSPNGATVAYVNNNNSNLETIPIGGGLPNVVVAKLGTIDQVSWSPDGTKIAVNDLNHCAAATPIGVVSATANNAAPTCLPNSAAGDTDPSFSPDGTKIAVSNAGPNLAILNANGIGRTDFTTTGGVFTDNYWAVQASTTTTTAPGPTTTTTPPCSGTLTGTAFKGSNPKPQKALAGVIVAAGSASSSTNGAGAYSITVPCGTVTKTATGPATKTRVCHFGSKSGPTSVTVTVTNGSVDIENLFCKKK
ncbi:MAG: hypothetical protein E6G57_15800 [Actinobacteria bacterium]|nr:MAG: hypothetical protein E6G57_15800 [Actinomycetota bacterium]